MLTGPFRNQRGTTFLTTMICSFLMALVGGYLYQMTVSDLHYVNRLKLSLQAQQLADAGLSRMLSALNNNWNGSVGGTLSANLGPGSYSASVSQSGGRYLVSSAGTVQGVQRIATAEVVKPSLSALDYAIAGGGNMNLDSGTANSPGTINGNVYSGGNLGMDGASNGPLLTINGLVQAAGNISTNATVSVSGSTTPQYETALNFPTPDLTFYKGIAQTNSTYYSGNQAFSNANPLPSNPPGGVIYIAGNVSITGTQTINGCLVVSGNLTITKSGSVYPQITINKFGSYPALIDAGNFGFSSTGSGGAFLTANSLVYGGGNWTFNSGNHDNLTINGSLIARGNLGMSPQSFNNVTVNYVAQNYSGVNVTSSGMQIVSYNR